MIRAGLSWRAAGRAVLCGAILALALGSCAPSPSLELRTLEQLTDMAQDGDPGAQAALGQAYEKGLGVRASIDQALRWYNRASEGGDPFAPFQIGALYERGVELGQDYERAAHWYQIAAERGNDTAQASLAYLYEHGLGVPQDYATAVFWYEAARITWMERAEYPVEAAFATGREGAEYVDPPPELLLAQGAPPAALDPPDGEPEDATVIIGEARLPGAADLPIVPPTDLPLDPLVDPMAALAQKLVTLAPAMPALDPGEVESASLALPDQAVPDPAPVTPVPDLAYAAHLASFRTADAAAREWDRLADGHGALFNDLHPWLDGVALGEDDAEGFVRLLAAPFANRADADRFCAALDVANRYCKVVTR